MRRRLKGEGESVGKRVRVWVRVRVRVKVWMRVGVRVKVRMRVLGER